MDDVFITLDVDWAPDAAIHATADLLERAGCRATWFVTHATPALERLRARADLFEMGIHPNFLPGSTHGTEPDEVLRHVIGLVPEARVVRAHGATQSGPILRAYSAFPQLELDCSVMFPGLEHARAVPYGDGRWTLWRVPNFWSDDYEAEQDAPLWTLDDRLAVPGAKVLIFHPVHVALNSPSMTAYAELKRTGLTAMGADDVRAARHPGEGAGTLFEDLAGQLGAAGGGGALIDLVPRRAEGTGYPASDAPDRP